MAGWLRLYDEILDDPKVQKLSGDDFKAWVNLLCLASQSGGEIPSLADAAFALRLPETKAGAIIADLAKRELMDPVDGGYFRPHNWDKRQYKSDVTDPTNLGGHGSNATAAAKRSAGAIARGVVEGLTRKGPTDINKAPEKDLAQLPSVTPAQAKAIIAGRPYDNTSQLVKRRILTKAQYEKIRTQIGVN